TVHEVAVPKTYEGIIPSQLVMRAIFRISFEIFDGPAVVAHLEVGKTNVVIEIFFFRSVGSPAHSAEFTVANKGVLEIIGVEVTLSLPEGGQGHVTRVTRLGKGFVEE